MATKKEEGRIGKRERDRVVLAIDCEVCGEPVYLSKKKYLEHKRARTKPLCRKNGCEQLSESLGLTKAARQSSVITEIDVGPATIALLKNRRGKRNGPNARFRVIS